MRHSQSNAAIALAAMLALACLALATSISPVARAQGSISASTSCPVTFDRLHSALEDADDEDSTGFNNHYWAVVVNRAGAPPAGAVGAERYDHAERRVGSSTLPERPGHAGGDAVGRAPRAV